MKTNEDPIVVEQIINASPKATWNALTQQDLMVQWYFDNIPEFRPEVGFSTEFKVTNEGRGFTHCWKVIKAIENQVISYQWNYKEYEGDSLVSFELAEKDSGTLIKLTHAATKDFVDDLPEFKRESGVQGWNYLISDRLKPFLEG